MRFTPIAFGMAGLGLAALAPVTAAPPSAPYADYRTLTSDLEGLAKAHGKLARLQSIGATREGRKLWMLEIAGPGPVPAAERPALFIAANLEGDQLVGSALAFAIAKQLLEGYASDAAIKTQLDSTTLYILPRINADAAEDMFAKVQTGRRTNTTPFDDDNDGRVDEDGPEDLNGDGVISAMRVADPEGAYMIDPDDARLMKKADPLKNERGAYTLYWEGIDNDGDGFYNEDPPGGADLNRNFQHEYPYYTPDAGRHMVSEMESRALMEFFLTHRNIAAMYVLGASDNLVVAPDKQGELAPAREVDLYNFMAQANREVLQRRTPPALPKAPPESAQQQGGGGRRGARPPSTTVHAADRDYFSAVSEKYRELTGIKTLPMVRAPQGALFEYGYYQFGVPSFSTPGWGLTEAAAPAPADAAAGDQPKPDTAKPKPPGDKGPKPTAAAAEAQRSGRPQNRPPVAIDGQLAQWFDKEKVDGLVPWAAYRHPTLKNVEIGGFKPYAVTNPPGAMVSALVPAQTKFAVYLASLLPRAKIASVEVKSHGGGLYRITADVENTGFFPTALAHAVMARAVKPTMVQLDIDAEKVIGGKAKTSFVPTFAGSGGRERFEWIVQGARGQKIELKVQAQKGGTVVQTVTLP